MTSATHDGREMRIKIKKQLGILDLKRPRWRYKGDESEPIPPKEDLMKGMLLFRSIVKCILFPLRLQKLVHLSEQESVHKDQEDVAEFMNLYFDLSKNWLSSLVKTPVLSVVKNSKLNLDIASKHTASDFTANMKAMFGAGKKKKDIVKEKLMQCKVRVKGLLDVLLSACRVSKASTSNSSSKGIPQKLCEFLAKYFVMDGVAFPSNYLFKYEERALEFNVLGMTRRMVYREKGPDQEDGEDNEAATLDLNNDDHNGKHGYLNTSRPRMLIINFLICRVLINEVLMNTKNCQGLRGGGSNSSNSSSNNNNSKNTFNYKTTRNLQYLASMFYLILLKLHEDLDEPFGTPIQKKKNLKEDDGGSSSSSDTKKGANKKKNNGKKNGPKTPKRRNPDIFTLIFEDGPMGLDLEAWHNGKGASIVGIKEDTQAAKMRKLFEGQHFIKIGRRKVENLQFNVILGMLKKLKRPLKITLREHPTQSKWIDEHKVRFPAGPLGLDLAPGSGQVGTVVTGSKSGEVRPGEYIIKIGDKMKVGGKDLKDTIDIIKGSKRPIEIWFVRVRNKPTKGIDGVDGDQKKKLLGAQKTITAVDNIADDSDSDDEKGSGGGGGVAKGGVSKFKWATMDDLTSHLLPVDVFNKAFSTEKEVEDFDIWLESMADRLDQWGNVIIQEVMKCAKEMQTK